MRAECSFCRGRRRRNKAERRIAFRIDIDYTSSIWEEKDREADHDKRAYKSDQNRRQGHWRR